MADEHSAEAKHLARLEQVKLGPDWLMPVILTMIGLAVAGVILMAVFTGGEH